MGWFFLASILLLSLCGCCETVNHIFRKPDAAGAPVPQSGSGSHGQPQAGSSLSTPGPGGGGSTGGATGSGGGGGSGSGGGETTGFSTGTSGAAPAASFGTTGGTIGGGSTGGGAGGGAAASGTGSKGPARRGRGWRDWRRGDPTLIKGLWKSKGPLDSLGKAEIYIILALLIGFLTVVFGCWLSDNCWSPEPEGVVTLA
ncbi:putative glycine-rich cell wall structural protein 1 isoform X1 [Monomorium pharaonis]|uniref:putative glycine-rich cell wall structural protein 1 isoform X1 n=1 Tax=Monomorium pharaonis TaxID=307658 RepID=UPI00063EF8EE|nr:putative glycine-rich cell wall structural protein 1 isoform X1 [Monomorium pharaonis]XP_036145244.1 putative glycine-rich cell wall structural protein 1 isoform X1 [Monomorium pharaonis]XP_036145245.1 putative glycine-rich cell wall structural protein 1 isoform X1 [Monomorium pharaonis]